MGPNIKKEIQSIFLFSTRTILALHAHGQRRKNRNREIFARKTKPQRNAGQHTAPRFRSDGECHKKCEIKKTANAESVVICVPCARNTGENAQARDTKMVDATPDKRQATITRAMRPSKHCKTHCMRQAGRRDHFFSRHAGCVVQKQIGEPILLIRFPRLREAQAGCPIGKSGGVLKTTTATRSTFPRTWRMMQSVHSAGSRRFSNTHNPAVK